MRLTHKNVDLECSEDIPEEEAKAYVERYLELHPGLVSLQVEIDGDFANVTWSTGPGEPFERIRRITGYLVGTLERFNDAKRAEEADRVKHL